LPEVKAKSGAADSEPGIFSETQKSFQNYGLEELKLSAETVQAFCLSKLNRKIKNLRPLSHLPHDRRADCRSRAKIYRKV
jgi:hypothetical protein